MSRPEDARYKPTWESLACYEVPQWFKDAKLGIFIHWGVYSVPAFGNEWYPRNMYLKDNPAFEHHRRTWGAQSEFGYKHFIPMFKAERWDPEEWVDLFARSGAKYVVPVAEHHDGFPMYDCSYTQYNSAKMGPCRDVTAELARATRDRGLRFGVSSHRAFNWRYYTFAEDFDTNDAQFAGLYGPAHGADEPASEAFLKDWFARTRELVDKFQPDVLWFDFGWHQPEFAPYWPQVAAYYYNAAERWGSEGVLNYKDKFPPGTAVYDIERGKLEDIREEYWQTDTAVSYRSWGYIQEDEFKSVTTLVHDLVDIVSKNGNLLLNIGPRPDGTIPQEAADRLLGIGQWLQVNGEAVYGTSHWQTFGEGETKVAAGHHTEGDNKAFTCRDIRFTKGDSALYAIFMGWPGKQMKIASLGAGGPVSAESIDEVTMLGVPSTLEWSQDASGLTIAAPPEPPCEHAYTVRIGLKG